MIEVKYSVDTDKNNPVLIDTIEKAEKAINSSNIPSVAQWKLEAWSDNSLTFKIWTKGYDEARKFYPTHTVEDMHRRIGRTIERIGMLREDLI